MTRVEASCDTPIATFLARRRRRRRQPSSDFIFARLAKLLLLAALDQLSRGDRSVKVCEESQHNKFASRQTKMESCREQRIFFDLKTPPEINTTHNTQVVRGGKLYYGR
ncbi:hypothetical protein TcasGA2_TC009152 [Tribolium castaneum]|uniref:Uncharacterized protein n=1 Tax=Tribolium castaneum TaxID=7070 RepID=D6WTR1_TRICA|nr:hypothetical protein TcasGA2_TC009152 [Tribolium castaneum]